MVKRGLLHIVLSIVLGFSAFAEANPSCENIFRSEARTSHILVSEKFKNPGYAGRFLQIVDQKISTVVRVQVRTAVQTGSDAERAAAEFDVLIARGLSFEPIAESEKDDDPDRADILLTGTADLVLAALRHSAIQSVQTVQEFGALAKPRYFSNVEIGDAAAGRTRTLAEKFGIDGKYPSLRQNLFSRDGTEHSVMFITAPVERSGSAFRQFLKDIASLGLRVFQTAQHGAIGKPVGPMEVHVQGSIEGIYSVIRHPGVEKVAGFKSRRPRELAVADMASLYLGPARFEIVDATAMKNEAFFERPNQSAEEVRHFQAYRNSDVPSLLHMQISQREDIAHETQTAIDYAKFVRRHHQQDFAYVSELNGRNIPIFDGLLLTGDSHEAVGNVSLKYCTTRVAQLCISNLELELGVRLKKHVEKEHLLDLEQWMYAANYLGDGGRSSFEYESWVQRAAKTGILFGLPGLDATGMTAARPAHIVIDVRHHGYDFEFFKSAEVQRKLARHLKQVISVSPLTVTYLWNDRQGIEITATAVKIYE